MEQDKDNKADEIQGKIELLDTKMGKESGEDGTAGQEAAGDGSGNGTGDSSTVSGNSAG